MLSVDVNRAQELCPAVVAGVGPLVEGTVVEGLVGDGLVARGPPVLACCEGTAVARVAEADEPGDPVGDTGPGVSAELEEGCSP